MVRMRVMSKPPLSSEVANSRLCRAVHLASASFRRGLIAFDDITNVVDRDYRRQSLTLRTFGDATCRFLVCRLLGKFYFLFSSHDYEIEACSLTASEQWVMFHICRRRRCGRRRRSYRSAMMRSERRHFLRITIMIMKILAKRLQDGSKTAPSRSKTAYSLLFCLHEAQGLPFCQPSF